MPVFHTKTIESILEPVAQQVSNLVILHEEGEGGSAIPDLTVPVHAVSVAVNNLVKVSYDTINHSKDQILKQDMPPALQRVEESSEFLVMSAQILKNDPYSADARSKLIDGSRGILQGTSALLLAFDESEVRKILLGCKSVLDYLAVTEVVDRMEDLVTFVRNLSPILTKMAKDVDNRVRELIHQAHCQMLLRSLEQVKSFTPVLISGIKIFITASQTGQGMAEAKNNRDYTVRKMSDEIHEIMRVLQLTTYDEDEWDADDITVMKKAQNAIDGKMKSASDWLTNPAALVGSLGDKALRQIIDDSRKIADRCTFPQNRDQILRHANDIESMVNVLSELRQQGKGSSPEALSIVKTIKDKLGVLQNLTAQGIADTEHSGVPKPAPTVDGKVEQAMQWLANPALFDKGLGENATRMVVNEGRKVANCCTGPQRQELLRLCDETEILTHQLADLTAKGMGNSPQARAIAANLSSKLDELQNKIQNALVHQVAENFNDPFSPLNALSAAARLPPDAPNRNKDFDERARAFEENSGRFADTANSVATAGGCRNKQTVEAILKNSNQLRDLTPQVVNAARVLFSNPDNPAAIEHFELLKKQWEDNMDRIRSLTDEAVDSTALIRAEEQGILKDTERVETAIKQRDPYNIVDGSSSIAHRAKRVVQVAEMEAQNSEDPQFVHEVDKASKFLNQAIPPQIQIAKSLSQNPANMAVENAWRKNNRDLIQAVCDVRKAVTVESQQPAGYNEMYPPPPDMSQLHISVPDSYSNEARNAHEVREAPHIPVETPAQEGNEVPPRPPLPNETAPPRPPPPETDDEDDTHFPEPQENQPIMMAAHALHMETKQWSSKDNEIIMAAKKMALLMAKLSQLVRGEGTSKKDLIATAKGIVQASNEVTRLAKKLAAECTDKKMRMNLLNVCERIPTIGTQLKILTTVKATMLGTHAKAPPQDAEGSEEDQEATDMLVGNAQNLMQAVKETVRSAEAASIKIRVDSGYTIRWARKRPWYT